MTSELLTDDEVSDILPKIPQMQGAEREQALFRVSHWRDAARVEQKRETDFHFRQVYTNPARLEELAQDPLVQEAVKLNPDPDAVKYGAANRAYLKFKTGRELAGPDYDAERDGYAKAFFGKERVTEKEFASLVGGQYQTEIQRETAQRDLIQATSRKILEDTLAGVSQTKTSLAPVLAEIKAKYPDVMTGKDDGQFYVSMLMQADKVKKDIEKFKGPAARAWDGLTKFTDGKATEADLMPVVDELRAMPQQDRAKIYQYALMAAEAGGMDRKAFAQKFGETLGRGTLGVYDQTNRAITDRQLRADISQLQDAGRTIFVSPARSNENSLVIRYDGAGRAVTPAEREIMLKEREQSLSQLQIIRELNDAAVKVDPIESDGFLESAALGVAGSVGYMALAAVPAAGAFLAGSAIWAGEYERILNENPDLDPDTASNFAMASAVPQMLAERFQVKTLMGTAPAFSRVLNEMATGKRSWWAQFGIRSAGINVAENITEGAQDMVPVLIDQIGAAFNEDFEDKDFAKQVEGWREARVETFAALLPLSLLGGGFAAMADIKNGRQLLSAVEPLRMQGLSEEQAARVIAQPSDEAKVATFQKEFDARTPENIAEGLMLAEQARDKAFADQGAPDKATIASNVLPDGSHEWTVTEPDGTQFVTKDQDAAVMAFDEANARGELFQKEAAREEEQSDEGQKEAAATNAQAEILFSKSGPLQDWLNETADSAISGPDVEAPTESEGRRAIADLNAAKSGGGFEYVSESELSAGQQGGMAQAKRLASLFGRRVVVYRNSAQPHLNGVTNTGHQDKVFLNADSYKPYWTVAGHELWHHIQIEQPELAKQAWSAIKPEIRNLDAFAAARREDGYAEEEIQNEFMGDFLGDSAGDAKFWDKLAARDRGLFLRFATAVKQWLAKVAKSLRKHGFGSYDMLSDIERAQDVLSDAVHRFASGSKKPLKPDLESDPNQNFYSGRKAEYEKEVLAALDASQKNPEERLAMFERARKLMGRVMEENAATLAGMDWSNASGDKISRTKLIQAIGQLDALLSVFPAEIQGKVGGFTTLTKIGTGETALADFFVKRVKMIGEELERALRKEYDEKLWKLFKRAQPAKDQAGKKRVGKAGAEIHALFDVLREATRWSETEADAHIAGREKLLLSGELTPDQEAHTSLEIDLIPHVMNWKQADSERRAAAVENLTRVFERGYTEFRAKKNAQASERIASREQLRSDAGTPGQAPERKRKAIERNGFKGTWGDSLLGLLNFEQMTQWVFGDKSLEAQSLADREREAAHKKQDALQRKMQAVEDVFTKLAGDRFKGQELRWKMAQSSMTIDDLPMSELEGIAATMMWMQEDGRRHMAGKIDDTGKPVGEWHYDQAFIDKIEKSLSPDAKAVRAYLVGEYGKEYATLNPIYRDLNGVDLPRHKNYSPLTVKPMQAQGGQTIDPVTGNSFSTGSITPGSLRKRGSATAEPDFRDALQTFIAHTKQMEHWKAYAKLSSDAQALLNNREVGNSVEAAAGKEAVQVLRGWLDIFAQGGSRDASAHLAINQALSRMASRAASIALVGRIGTLAIQSTQLAAASAEMSIGAYLSRLGRLFAGDLDWRGSFDSPYIQRRLQEMPPIVRQAVEGMRAEKPNQLRYTVAKLGELIGGTDAVFTAGTYAIVRDYQLAQAKESGLTGADAENFATQVAERIVDRIAQPTRAGARSLFENYSTNPFARLAWAFASDARKNLALAAYALAKRPAADKARAIGYVWMLNGLMASVIRAAWSDARDGEDDELFDEKHWSLKRITMAIATEPLYGIPVFGEKAQAMTYKAFGEYHPEGDLFSSMGRALPAIKRITETLTGEQEAAEVLRDVDAILSGMGLFNSNIAAAASLSHLAKDLFGVVDNMTGNEE